MAHDVFISYAHEDRTVANAVAATLESHSIRCWIAPRDILPGEDWGEAIIDAIKDAHAMVLIFSSHSNESEQIKREVERTVHQGIAIIPFRIEDVFPSKTLEYFISTQHWLDALTPPLEDHLGHLAETIQVLLAKKGFKEKPPGLEREEPAPPQPELRPPAPPREPPPAVMASAPPRQVPLVWLSAIIGSLAVIGVIGGLWYYWSRPAAAPPSRVPAVAPPVAPAPSASVPPAAVTPTTPTPPVTTATPAPQGPIASQPVIPTGPTASVKDGKLILSPQPNSAKIVFNQDRILPNDLDASVSLIYQEVVDSTYSSGLIFWAKDYSDFYVLSLTSAGNLAVQHYTGNRWLVPVSWRKIDSAKRGENVENILRVVTTGTEATAYVNGEKIFSFTGEPPPGGSLIGLRVSASPKGTNIVAFANLKVTVGSQVLGFQPDPKELNAIRLTKMK